MSTIKVSYLVYAEGTDSEGNRFYFEKDKTKDITVDIEDVESTDLEPDSNLFDAVNKDIHLYENKRTVYAFNKSNYKKNKIYCFADDNPGVTDPIGKVIITKMEIADIEVV